jgi:hypothetical protein
MIDISHAMELAGFLKTAGEMTKAMIGVRDGAMLQSKVIELNGIILSAQSSALSSNQDQFALLNRVRDLEKEIADLEAWETEKQRYELKNIGQGCIAYAPKAGMQPPELEHYLCANCFTQSKKRFLQIEHRSVGRVQAYVCNDCGAELYVVGVRHAESNQLRRR